MGYAEDRAAEMLKAVLKVVDEVVAVRNRVDATDHESPQRETAIFDLRCASLRLALARACHLQALKLVGDVEKATRRHFQLLSVPYVAPGEL